MRNFLTGLVAGALCLCAGYGLASRNSAGTMSAVNGPYISGTTITSAQINQRFADVENEITDSLSRSGKGGMTAAIKEADGSVSSPSFSFGSEPGSGLYRAGAADIGLAVTGAKIGEWTAAGALLNLTNGSVSTPSLSFLSEPNTGIYRIGAGDLGFTIGGTKYLDLTSSALTTAVPLALSGTATASATGTNATLTLQGDKTASDTGAGVVLDTSSIARTAGDLLRINNNGSTLVSSDFNGKLTVKGGAALGSGGQLAVSSAGAITTSSTVTLGASGTAITSSVSGSYSINPNSGSAIAGNACAESAQTLSGAIGGDVCIVGSSANLSQTAGNSGVLTCYVTGSGVVNFRWCASNGGWTPPNTTYTARTFH